MVMRHIRSICVAAAAVLFLGIGSSAGAGAVPSETSLAARPAFGLVGHAWGGCGSGIDSSGDYALIPLANGAKQGSCASNFLLVDDKTGVRHEFHVRNTDGPLAFGVPWVLFGISAHGYARGLDLYNVVTHRMKRLNCGCLGANGYVIGSRWLEFYVQKIMGCNDGTGVPQGNCGPNVYSYYDLVRHTTRRDLTTPNGTTVNLNSGKLIQRICRPLEVPAHGALTFYGPFAVATQPTPQGSNPSYSTTLEKCGSQLQTPLDAPAELLGSGGNLVATSLAVGNSHAVAWAVTNSVGEDTGQVEGVLLPSLQSFSFTIPAAIETPPNTLRLAMDAERLYVIGNSDNTWSAPFP